MGENLKVVWALVFNFKLGCFVMCAIGWHIQVRLSQEWKTLTRFHPVSLSLPMTYIMAAVTIDLIICKLDHYNMVGVTDYGKQSSLFLCRIKCRRKKCYSYGFKWKNLEILKNLFKSSLVRIDVIA
jgi:hypothetical protein